MATPGLCDDTVEADLARTCDRHVTRRAVKTPPPTGEIAILRAPGPATNGLSGPPSGAYSRGTNLEH